MWIIIHYDPCKKRIIIQKKSEWPAFMKYYDTWP